jgi:hypothetical protein
MHLDRENPMVIVIRTFCVALTLMAALPPFAQAVVTNWTLDNVFFQTGGPGFFAQLSGSFDYDSDANLYSNIALTSAAGSLFLCNDSNGDNLCDGAPVPTPTTGSDYTTSDFEGGAATGLRLGLFTDGSQLVRRTLILGFAVPLQADPVALRVAAEFLCAAGGCGAVDVDVTPFRSTAINGGGRLTPAVVGVPEPASLMLFGVMALMVGLMRWPWRASGISR